MIELTITGMSCEHCVRAVKEALEGVVGVTGIKTLDLESGLALVEGQVNPGALVVAVKAVGYGAELVSE
jgi:copper chaperone